MKWSLHQKGETQSDITRDRCDSADHVTARGKKLPPPYTQSTAARDEPNERHTYSVILDASLKILDLHVRWLPPQERTDQEPSLRMRAEG